MNGDAWSLVLPHLTLPANPKSLDELVQSSIEQDNALVLYAFLRWKMARCTNIKEEQKLIGMILDWLKSFNYSERVEPKLPLLYASFFLLVFRQLEKGSQEVAHLYLAELADVLEQVAQVKGGFILSLSSLSLGRSGPRSLSPRARFLAIAVALSIRTNFSAQGEK